ncbi:MAG: aspartate-semialdehyde dehydrogenase [Gammaproteobacteria bacterium]|nr:aspartate-semialdehyde dehydrogenase [Gammaproteobacteria bacterium]
MKKFQDIAVIGATGMVGSILLSLLEERDFPVRHLYLLASERSVGEIISFRGKSHPIQALSTFDFSKTQLCFFCASNDIAKKYAPIAAEKGNIIIDKSSYFRMDPEVPLVVPEVNPGALRSLPKNIIASPNCSTIPVVVALKPIFDAVGIERINVATYQSVSGSGRDAVKELAKQTAQLLNGQPISPSVYPQQIAFNVLPHIDAFEENGYTREEMKVVNETRKILDDSNLMVNATAVRVPVFFGHSIAVHAETRKKLSAKDAMLLLSRAPGITLFNDPATYPTPVHDAAGKDDIFVGRVRDDISHPRGLNLWIVADNVRKGAALNAIQIAEYLNQ